VKNMKKRSIWALKLPTIAITLIPAAIGINYLGKLFAGLLKLPVWLDAIGTVLSSMLGGPIIGAASAIVNNIDNGMTVAPISTASYMTSRAIGLLLFVMFFNGCLSSIKKFIRVGIIVCVIATIVPSPLNFLF